MTRDEAKIYVKSKLKDYLEEKGIDVKKNFRCLAKTHEDENPSMSFDRKRNKVHCFSCKADLSTFDLIAIDFQLTETREIFEQAYRIFNIDVKGLKPSLKQIIIPVVKQQNRSVELTVKASNQDVFLLKACSDLHKTTYLQERGISRETADRFGIGFSPKGQEPWPSVAAVVIPTSNGSFVARNVDPAADHLNRYRKYGPSEVFNFEATRSGKPCFVVEGEFDALSVEEFEFPAVGLGSINNMDKFITLLKADPPISTLIILLDRDAQGEKSAEILTEELQALKIPHLGPNDGIFLESYNDPNAFLIADREVFQATLSGFSRLAELNFEEKSPIDHQETFLNL